MEKIKVGDTLYFIPTYQADWRPNNSKPGTPVLVTVTKVGTKYLDVEAPGPFSRVSTYRLHKDALREVGGWGGRAWRSEVNNLDDEAA